MVIETEPLIEVPQTLLGDLAQWMTDNGISKVTFHKHDDQMKVECTLYNKYTIH
jgi:hypothetical protein